MKLIDAVNTTNENSIRSEETPRIIRCGCGVVITENNFAAFFDANHYECTACYEPPHEQGGY